MLPVLIELREIRVSKTDDRERLAAELMAYVKKALRSIQDYRMDECLEAYLRKRGILLLLDGAHEIHSSEYLRIEAAIVAISARLARDSPATRIVLTMRTQLESPSGNSAWLIKGSRGVG
jgi:hypothetical protein